VTARERASDEKASFINRLLENTDEHIGRKLNDFEVAEELIGIIFGGAGTSANTMTFLVWEVLKNPDIHKKLMDELLNEYPEGGIPAHEDASRLPYLNAVIMETLRRYPTIPGLQPRKVVARDVTLGAYKVPAGVRYP
jgi:cytochrome P450